MKLNHHFLLSMSQIQSDYFAKSLIYICEHDERGAIGLIINRYLDINIRDVLEEISDQPPQEEVILESVYDGGPVAKDHGLIIHHSAEQDQWPGTQTFSHDICISNSQEILDDIGSGLGPKHYMMMLGHAGWGPKQLESELAENAWLSIPASHDILFKTPAHLRSEKAVQSIGIDLINLSSEVGHA